MLRVADTMSFLAGFTDRIAREQIDPQTSIVLDAITSHRPEPETIDSPSTDVTTAVQAALTKIERVDAQVNAWAHLPQFTGIARASAGPLHARLVGIKDLIDVAGMPTRCGSRHGSSDPATVDAGAVSRIRRAGGVLIGKTTTHEYAFGGTTPPTRNPWDLDRIPGGSSGGSAAALASGSIPLALGSDTAGSVRIPAAMCGVVGFMGSHGSVPTDGCAVLSWSLDNVGAMARTVDDVALLHRVIADSSLADIAESTSLPTVVGVPFAVLDPLHPHVRQGFENTLTALTEAGVQIREVELPDADLAEAIGFILMMAESAVFHRERMRKPELFDEEIAGLLEVGAQTTTQQYLAAVQARVQMARRMDDLFADTPHIITPTIPCEPAPFGSGTFTELDLGGVSQPLASAHTRFTLYANIAGSPAGSLPAGVYGGLPVGVQLMGRRGRDHEVLQAMAGLERVIDQAGLWSPGQVAPEFMEEK